jgi:hypothetical protein
MMYRTRADGDRVWLTPGDVVPRNVCQPPVDAMQLMEQLNLAELRQVVRTMIIWTPEAFERGLENVSKFRSIRNYFGEDFE